MKKSHKSVFYAALLAMMIQLLSSCGSVGITKMRYSNGYNLELFANKKKQEREEKAAMAFRDSIVRKNAERLAAKQSPAAPAENIAATGTTVNSVPAEAGTTAATEIAKTEKTKTETPAISRKEIKREIREARKMAAEMKHSDAENTGTTVIRKMHQDSETDTIILVILALFPILCLIAVYLHDGGVTTNFWVDLILHITFIGEIIFALLVVLDIVDLS